MAGLGIGLGLGLLFAPMSGEDTREWLAESAEDRLKRIRRQSRRWVYQVQDVLDKGEDKVTKVLRTGKSALDSTLPQHGHSLISVRVAYFEGTFYARERSN
jgi:gas vesicle protein